MRSLRSITLSFAALSFLSAAPGCGGTDQQPEMPNPSIVDRSADDMGLPEASAESEGDGTEGGEDDDSEPPTAPVQVVAGESTPIEGGDPQLTILAPRNDQVVAGDVTLRIRLRNWDLQPAPGSHVHVIVDNEPYIAVRDVSGPINLTELVHNELGHDLAAGTHVVRVFPSRGHHESVKRPGAFAVVVFHAGTRTAGFSFDAHAPLLTYSRPKGCNVSGERILLDFYVSNTQLSDSGSHVHYSIDDAIEGDITNWVPHWIEGLPSQQHTLHLTLTNAAGEPIPGPFNDTTRTFTVAASCQ